MDGLIARRTDRIDVRDEQMDRWTNTLMDGETETNGQTDRLTKEWMEGGRAGGRTDGQTRHKEKQTDGRTEE